MAYRNCTHRFSESENCETCTREDWHAWRTDYRCQRPAVTCEGCGTHYRRGQDEGNATYIGYSLKSCGNCQTKAKRHFSARQNAHPNGIREIHRDIAVRYIGIFGGSTFAVQTEIDDCEIYLRNAFGLAIAKVLSTDRYEKPVEVFDLPF